MAPEPPDPPGPDDGDEPRGAASDAALLRAARAGSVGAYALLYEEHRSVAVARARHLLGRSHRADAEDVVEVTFAAVFDAMRNGAGPVDNFRRYLMVALRHESWRHTNRRSSEALTDPILMERDAADRDDVQREVDDADLVSAGLAGLDLAVDPSPRGIDPTLLLADAFRSLTEAHRTVLWLSEVEGREPAELGPLLGVTANAAAARAYRARLALRAAYFRTYQRTLAREECIPIVPRLEAFVEADQEPDGFDEVVEHTGWCASCRDVLRGAARSSTGLAALLPLGALSSGLWLCPDRATAGPAPGGAGPAVAAYRRPLAVAAAVTLLAVGVWLGLRPGADTSDHAARLRREPSGPMGPAPTEDDPTVSTATTDAPSAASDPAVTTTAPGDGQPEAPAPPGATTVGSIEGQVSMDHDGTGGDAAKPATGVPVQLVDAAGEATATTSMVDGSFLAGSLRPGTYRLLATVPVGLLPLGSTAAPAPSGTAQTVEVRTVSVQAGQVADVTVDLVPWRRLHVGSGVAADPTVTAGTTAHWSFALTSAPAAVDGTVLDVAIAAPASAQLELPSDRCTALRRDGARWVATCTVGRATAAATAFDLAVLVRSGAQGSMTPTVTLRPGTGYARSATATGRPVSISG